MFGQVRSHLIAASRLALACVAVGAVLGAATAAASGQKQHKAQSAAIGAVYTETNGLGGNAVVVFDRFGDGTLAWRQTVSTGGVGSTQSVGCGPGCPILDSQNAVVASSDGALVFAVNAGSNTVSSFRETGVGLTLVDQVSSGGATPESLALHGDLLYVLNVDTANGNGTTGNIYGLRVSGDGHLTPVGSSQPLAHPAPLEATSRAIDFDPTGTVIVVTELIGGAAVGGPPGAIDTFVVGSDGKAGPVASHPLGTPAEFFPFGFAFDNKGHLVVSQLVNPFIPGQVGSVSTYAVSSTGDVAHIDTQSSGGQLPCWVATTNNGKLTYVVNTGVPFPPSVAAFGLTPGGALSALGSPFVGAGDFARTDVDTSRDSKYLYVLAPSVGPGPPSHIDEYSINKDGSLTSIGSTPAGANLGIGATGLAAL